MKAQKFDYAWFESQYGTRPTQESSFEITQRIDDLKYRLCLEEEKLKKINEYTIREDVAIKSFVIAVYNSKFVKKYRKKEIK